MRYVKRVYIVNTRYYLSHPQPRLIFRHSTILCQKVQQVSVFGEAEKYEVLSTPLKYIGNVHNVRVVNSDKDVKLAW